MAAETREMAWRSVIEAASFRPADIVGFFLQTTAAEPGDRDAAIGLPDEPRQVFKRLRRIMGRRCSPIPHYRRVMNLDTPEKTNLMCHFLKEAGQEGNLYLATTELRHFFELLIVDREHGFFLFHAPDRLGSIDAVLRISDHEVVRRMDEIYDAIWKDRETTTVKSGALDEEEVERLCNGYSGNVLPDTP